MMRVATLAKQEKRDLDKINDANNRLVLNERSRGLCEICYRGYDLVLHHIGGRGKPGKSWPEELQEEWPHIPLNTIIICQGTHGAGDRSGRVHTALRHNRGPLWAWLKDNYGETIFRGKTYREWFEGPGPWERMFETSPWAASHSML